jgi:hypothetical protein
MAKGGKRPTGNSESTFIATEITEETTLIQMLFENGLLQGPRGRKSVNTNLRQLLNAIYHVLAGGTVEGTVPGTISITAGNKEKVGQFMKVEKQRLNAVNKMNDKYDLITAS